MTSQKTIVSKKFKALSNKIGQTPKPLATSAEKVNTKLDKLSIGQIIGTGLVIILILILPVLIFSIGLYVFHWNDPITNKIVKIVPYPAAVVDYSVVTYEHFCQDLDQLAYYYQKQAEVSRGSLTAPSRSEIESMVLSRLIDEKIIAQEAARREISVLANEADQEYQKIITQAQSANQLESTLSNYYNYSPQEFKEKALSPFLLRRKLDLALKQDSSVKAQAQQKADELHNQLENNIDEFALLAEEFSDLPSHLKGGDTGYINISSLDQVLRSEVEKLKIGEITSVIETAEGYYIVLLEEKITTTAGQDKIKGRQILIAPKGVEEWLTDKKGQLFIWRFVD